MSGVHGVHNITVPYVALADFDWSFKRTGPLLWNQTVWSLITVFTAFPLWMTVELTVWVFYVFRRYTGLYFWSVLITTWGVTLHAIGFVLEDCVPSCPWQLSTTIAEIGWVSMVSGFSVVLYSRLHPVIHNQRILQVVLVMIITDAFLFHLPTIVFQYGLSNKKTHKQYLPFIAPMERVQVLGFSIQEIIISCIYIYGTLEMLRDSFNKKIRQTTLLQLEFVILNQFRDVIAKGGLAPRGVEDLQTEYKPSHQPLGPPSPPSGSDDDVADKRWWSSRSVSVNTPLEATPLKNGHMIFTTPPTPPTQHGSTRYHKAMHGLAVTTGKPGAEPPRTEAGGTRNSEPIKQYQAGRTDVWDIERQYLATWDQGDTEI
ncbi:hypothetical protein D0Z07_0372 [Hyphodiscus hymeniophilus]|uniref:DUF7703 domain-containing protein n=1 Tax=Hyphodiscus hymeniophilus TaxID=353542 RepID=A0A9P7B196_9HELO|nr:hypothetical protein D0Z07_0372 [Hyphodiscus hymeniophilus]